MQNEIGNAEYKVVNENSQIVRKVIFYFTKQTDVWIERYSSNNDFLFF